MAAARGSSRWAALLCALFCCATAAARAQHSDLRPPAHGVWRDGAGAYAMPQISVESVLLEMSSRAAVIFVGTVTTVHSVGPSEAHPDDRDASTLVEVAFAVEQSVRGPVAGTTYRLREWAGLWRDGARFAVGQRRLMLLHAPGRSGLSSPVDGLDGAIPIAPAQAALPSNPAALGDAQATLAFLEARADLRWIAVHQLRTASSVVSAVEKEESRPSLTHVLGLLRGIQESPNAAP